LAGEYIYVPTETTTFIDLFAGIGGFRIALNELGLNCVFSSEIDTDCAEVYKQNFGDSPQGDLTKINLKTIPPHDILCGGFPCFAGGTLVLTIDGYRPIEELVEGDFVLTHKGRWRPVTQTMSRKEVVTLLLKVGGTPESIITTQEHPFLARKRDYKIHNKKRIREFTQPNWVSCKELTPDYFLGQILPVEDLEDDHSCAFWWLVGRYLADGWRIKRYDRKTGGRVIICCNKKETAGLQVRIKKAGLHAFVVEERTVNKFHISNNGFYNFLEGFGHLAHGKTIPGWALSLPKAKAKSFLLGYLSGDGYFEKGKWIVGSVSKPLALGIALLAQKVFGIICSVVKHIPSERKIIEGRDVRQRDRYVVSIPRINRSFFIEDRIGWKKIKKIDFGGEKTVYNLSVLEDESYLVEGNIVHNCQPFSISGKKQGFEDTRGTLFFEISRIVGYHKPKVVFLENVRNLVSHDKGNTLSVIINTLEALDYRVFVNVLNASEFNIPTSRQRLYIVAFHQKLGIKEFTFPSGENKKINLQSFLCKNADEKYTVHRNDIRLDRALLPIIQNKPVRAGSLGLGRQGERIYSAEWGHAITFSATGGGIGSTSGIYLTRDGRIRKLNPRECYRVMGFPESYIISQQEKKAYKQIGNSVAIPVIKAILEQIFYYIKDRSYK